MPDLTQYDLVPIMQVVKAAIMDVGGDIGSLQELYLHFASREYFELQRTTIRQGKHSVLLNVSPNTFTATLPIDFEYEMGLYVIKDGIKYPLQLNTNIVNSRYIEEIECEDKCAKCNQNKSICNDLVITETINIKTINGQPYDETVVKKLYPNGDYYLETTTPVLDLNSSPLSVTYVTTKKFITNLDLKDCGCLDDSEINLIKLQECCPDVYNCYYARCSSNVIDNFGGYNIFPENGLIQFDFNFKYSQIYLEYHGFLLKMNGTYYLPKVAFEALVEGVKYRAIRDRKNVPIGLIQMKKIDRNEARAMLKKMLSRITLNEIIDLSLRNPKFNSTMQNWYSNFCTTTQTITETSTENTCP